MQLEGNLYFKDHTLILGYWARFWSRILKGILGIVLGALSITLLLSDVPTLFYSGIGLSIYWVYRFIGKKLLKRRSFKGGNLFHYTTYRTKKLIESAYDKSIILGGSVLLNVTRELADTYQVEALLHRLGVERSEFIAKTEQYLDEEKSLRETNKWRQARVEELVVKSLIIQRGEREPIAPVHLFRALIEVDSEKIQRLFGTFGVEAHNLDQVIDYVE